MLDPIAFFLVGAMAAVVWLDATRYTIPNWLVLGLLLVYPLAYWLHPGEVALLPDLGACALMLAVGMVLFALRWMGGGDVKLLAVLALWVGWKGLLPFVVYVGLCGGVLTVALLLARRVAVWFPMPRLPRLLQPGAPVPYGLAMAAAFICLLAKGQIPVL